MKLIFSKEELVKGLAVVMPITARKTTLPVLSNILVEVEHIDGEQSDKVKLSATDLEASSTCYVKAEIVEKGDITVPAQKFNEIIKEVGETIEFSTDNDKITIKSGKAKFTITGIYKQDFPTIPAFDHAKMVSVKALDFADLFAKTMFCSSKDNTKYVLNGVHISLADGKMTGAATDGRRLACISFTGIPQEVSVKAIVPTKAAIDIIRLISAYKGTEFVQILIEDNLLSILVKDTLYQTRLIEGQFPQYERVIPKQAQTAIKVNTAQLTACVKQMALLAGEQSPSIGISFEKNKVEVFAHSANGESRTDMDIEYDGIPFEEHFNPNYLKEVLTNIDEDNIMFKYVKPQNPVVITPEKGSNYICVVMPMKK